MAHHHEQNGRIYVDTAFLNGTNRIPGVTLKHMGFGEFYAETPKGRVDFDRMQGKDFPGQSGRSHEFRGKGADWLLDQMERAGISVRVASKDSDMNADRSALIRLAALLPKGSPERRAILAGCEKLPEGPMRDNCEKSKKDGVKPGKGKAKSKGKKDDGKMPAELLEKFKAKKKAKRKAPPKEHQFTSEDNPNPKGNDKDGDGETNEPKPFKGKKAAPEGFPFMGRGGEKTWRLPGGEVEYRLMMGRKGAGTQGGGVIYFAPGASSGVTIARDGYHWWKTVGAAIRHAMKHHPDLIDQLDGYTKARVKLEARSS